MKKLVVFLAFALFFIILAGAISATIETNYYIYEKKVLVRHFFDSTADLELRIPADSASLEINSEYKIEEFSGYHLLKINSTKNLSVSYITQSMIDKSKDRYSFVSRNYLNDAQKIKLVLPESAVLFEQGLLFPEPDEISSDGRSVILIWNDYREKQIVVDYEFAKKRNFIFYIIILILILFFIVYFIFQRKIFKKKIEGIKSKYGKSKKTGAIKNEKLQEIEEHLMESEKAVIDELKKAERNQLWQRQLQISTGFSKAKLSRIIRNLEARNLIQKISFGNTNKIKLKIK